MSKKKIKVMSWKDRVICYRHISVQVANERPIVLALEDLKKRAKRKKNLRLAKHVGEMIARMKNGGTLSEAFQGKAPEDEIMILSSGDMSGRLPESLDLAIEAREKTMRVTRALRSAMMPPAILAGMVYIMLFVIGKFVIPSLTQAIPRDKARGEVALLFDMGDFFSSWHALVPIVLIVIVVLVVKFTIATFVGEWRVKAENVLPWSFYRDINGYSWMLSFLSLLRAGVSNVEILERQYTNSTPWMKERLRASILRMKNGESLSSSLMKSGFGFPNPDLIEDIASMENFPDFAERMTGVMNHYANELERNTTDKAKAAGFFVEMLMYGVIMFLVDAINGMTSQISTLVH